MMKLQTSVNKQEIRRLIRACTGNLPFIVKFYGFEHDVDFTYICLERCKCFLYDLIRDDVTYNKYLIQTTYSGLMNYYTRYRTWFMALVSCIPWELSTKI